MEHNGKQSNTKHIKHMDICYFYVTDHVKNKDINIKHYPTKDMVAEYSTKPLQGSLFVKQHNYIMGADYGDGDTHTQGCADANSYLDVNSEVKSATKNLQKSKRRRKQNQTIYIYT